MNYVDYKENIKRIDAAIWELQEEKSKMRDQFLEMNAKFKVGDKVVIAHSQIKLFNRISPERKILAFVSKVHDNYYSGGVRYEFAKVKKDGTASSQSAGVYGSYDNIELADPKNIKP